MTFSLCCEVTPPLRVSVCESHRQTSVCEETVLLGTEHIGVGVARDLLWKKLSRLDASA
jgi:hypothetical protein